MTEMSERVFGQYARVLFGEIVFAAPESVKSLFDLHLNSQFGVMITLVDQSEVGQRVSCSFRDNESFSFVTSNSLSERVALPKNRVERETDFENCGAWTAEISRDELLKLFANFCVEFEK